MREHREPVSQALRDEVSRAADVLKRGGLILYPTDTVWGIGCDATNEEAVGKIYALKRSENKHAMTVLVATADEVVRYVKRAPAVAWQLMELAESPLTLILPGGVGIAPNLIPEDGSIGIRVPRHEFCHQLLYRLRRPLVSTSANISGEKTPLTFGEIAGEIVSGVDMVVGRGFEGHPTRKPSSIIQLGESGEVAVIRD